MLFRSTQRSHALCICVADARGEQPAVARLDDGRHDIDLYKLAVLPRPECGTRTCLAHLRFCQHMPTYSCPRASRPCVQAENSGSSSMPSTGSWRRRPRPRRTHSRFAPPSPAWEAAACCRRPLAAPVHCDVPCVASRAPRARREQCLRLRRVRCAACSHQTHAPRMSLYVVRLVCGRTM